MDGVRIQKTVDSQTTSFQLDGTRIIRQQTGIGFPVWFEYDASGRRVAMRYLSTTYYYFYNAQGKSSSKLELQRTAVVPKALPPCTAPRFFL